jgi:hypothetical protein
MNATNLLTAHRSQAARDRHPGRPAWRQRFVEPLESRRLLSGALPAATCACAGAADHAPLAPPAANAAAAALRAARPAPPAAGPPDLTATVVAVPAGPLQVAGRRTKAAKVRVQLTNAGPGPAKGPTTLVLLASVDATADAGDVTLASVRQKLNLKPGRSKVVNLTFKPTAQTPSGDFFVLAQVDPANTLAETDETNNVAASAARVTIVNPAIPPGPTFTTAALDSDTTTLIAGAPEQVGLRATVTGRTASTAMEVDEVDAAGNVTGKLADLFDDGSGLHNDATAGDGVFNNTVAVGFDAPGDHFYVARLSDPSTGTTRQTAALTVSTVDAPTEAQVQQVMDTNAAIGRQASAALTAGQAPAAVLDATEASLRALPADQVRTGSIQRAGNTISWKNAAGMGSSVNTDLLRLLATVPAEPEAPSAPSAAAAARAASVAPAATEPAPDVCKQGLIISSFHHFYVGSDEAPVVRDAMAGLGWTVTSRLSGASADQPATLDDYQRLGRFGAVVIVAPGYTDPAAGLVIPTRVPVTLGARLSNAADLYNDRLLTYYDPVAGRSFFIITPAFVRARAGRMDKSVVYLGRMNGAQDPSLGSEFVSRGAASFLSYKDLTSDASTLGDGQEAFHVLLGPTNPPVSDIPHLNTAGHVQGHGDPAAKLPSLCRALADYDLVLQYTWRQTARDLDTNTVFLGRGAGYSSDNDSPYVTWTGDNTTTGGTETATIDLAKAHADGKFTTQVNVTANAGWFTPAGGSGFALLTVGLKDKVTGEIKDTYPSSIRPGTQTGAASTKVAEIEVTLTGDAANPEVTFKYV